MLSWFLLSATFIASTAEAQINRNTYLIQLVNQKVMLRMVKTIPNSHISQGNGEHYSNVYIEKVSRWVGGATLRMSNYNPGISAPFISAGTRFALYPQAQDATSSGIEYESQARVIMVTDALSMRFRDAIDSKTRKPIGGFRFQILGSKAHKAASMTVGQLEDWFGNIFVIESATQL